MFNRKFDFDPDPFDRFLLFAEGEEGDGGGGSGEEAAEGEPGEGDGQEGGKPGGEGADDWRAGIQDEKLRDHAGRFTSVLDLVGKHYELRKELSTAIKPLGKDPTEEQVAAYRKATGIPDTVEGYKFSVPEGHEITDDDKAFQTAAAQVFHKHNISAEQAEGLGAWWNEMVANSLQAQIDGDKAYADETMAILKKEWPGAEFDRNKAIANQAAAKIFGDDIDEIRAIETKDGRFILDHPAFIKMMAQYGREMQEGTLGTILSDGERSGVDAEIREFEQKIEKAQAQGDRTLANDLYRQQQALYAKAYGAGPVVGAEGRAV